MPRIPHPNVSSEDLYGSCLEIVNRTDDNYALVVDEYPDPRTLDWRQWQGWVVDDDYVLNDGKEVQSANRFPPEFSWWSVVIFLALACCFVAGRKYLKNNRRGYIQLK